MNMAMRWEYESPISERLDRLVNLDVAPDFTAAGQVAASAATGAVTGAEYPQSLVRADKRGFQPRLAHRLAAGTGIVAGRPCRLRHLSQHEHISVDCQPAGAAASAVDDI